MIVPSCSDSDHISGCSRPVGHLALHRADLNKLNSKQNNLAAPADCFTCMLEQIHLAACLMYCAETMVQCKSISLLNMLSRSLNPFCSTSVVHAGKRK